ncbi:spore germination protein GerPE [Halalkalibacter alkalisediminis]|uniref:Spore germination protein GerPE n=1 Tax=Halalkalibacter alkalisediminis TaxID=935616 RepID=A0ABV6NAD4_9BACI|nr:spore germination protein GerPE [Halalkalibacter alkalisediminis]
MFKRTSLVKDIHVRSVSSSSIFQIGDSTHITPRSRALAVQRQAELFYGKEGDFNQYSVFNKPIPKPQTLEHVAFSKYNISPFIKVNHIDILGVSASAVLHIGSTKTFESEARVKHIRQLFGTKE